MKILKIVGIILISLGIITGTYFLAKKLVPTQATPAAGEILLTNEGFNPPEIVVKKGTLVTFTNTDDKDYIIDFDFPGFSTSVELSEGSSSSFLYDQTGQWPFSVANSPINAQGMVTVIERQ